MSIRQSASAVGALILMASAWVGAQDRPAGPPGEAGPAAVAAGAQLFRERCAECHGDDGKGVPGHDLTRLWASGATDERVFQTIRSGVPNTLMPSSAAPDEELWSLVRYLRSLEGAAPSSTDSGDAANGERIFWSTCGGCHAVGGRGGRLGPDLSQVAENQSRAQLAQAIRSASEATAAGYQPVTLVTRDGQRIRGTLKGEDAFSIRLMDTRQRLQGYLKSTLQEVIREKGSLMPDFGPDRLSERDLDDLLGFMSTLRAAAASRP